LHPEASEASAWADRVVVEPPDKPVDGVPFRIVEPPVIIKGPEIDATAGVQAIALITGALLLLGEAIRRRRKK
jgi:hypothetical protein